MLIFVVCVRNPKKLRSSSSNNYFEARMLFWFDGEWLKFETGKLMTIQEWETKWTMCRHPIQRRAISKHWLRIICLFQHCGFRYTIWPLFLLFCAALIESRIVLWHLAIGQNAFDNDILPWWSTQFVLLCAEIQVNRHTKSKHSTFSLRIFFHFVLFSNYNSDAIRWIVCILRRFYIVPRTALTEGRAELNQRERER